MELISVQAREEVGGGGSITGGRKPVCLRVDGPIAGGSL